MQGKLNPRIVGACLIGFALVAGAYIWTEFNLEPATVQPAAVVVSQTTPRTAIPVFDADQNGVEDWRDEFIDTEPIYVDPIEPTDENYELPDTLTGQLGINFMESYLRSKSYGSFGRSQEELIGDTIDVLAIETAHDLYDTPDITILRDWENEDILTYANTIALAITNNNIVDSEGELFILFDILDGENIDRMTELQALADAYQAMRDETLATPVPAFLQKEHLDLINTYHAIHKDIEAMTITLDDPAFTLMRLKRYEDDAAGLGYALQNMYESLVPYAELLGPEDPAVVFVAFSPEFTS